MKASTLLLLLDAVLDLIERHLKIEAEDAHSNLLTISGQVHRLIALQLRLAEAARAQADRESPRAP